MAESTLQGGAMAQPMRATYRPLERPRKALWLTILTWVTPIGALAAQLIWLTQSLPDRDMGDLQKIFYVHVPAAKTAFIHASEVAKAAGRKVAITMSDVFCVDRHRESFVHLIRTHCDLVFANEAELLAIYETSDFEAAVRQIRSDSQIAAITRSSKGSVIVSGGDTWVAPVAPAHVTDATGAGDQYAAGVLYGITHGLSLQDSAVLGNLCAGEVIGHIGPRPAVNLRQLATAAGLKV